MSEADQTKTRTPRSTLSGNGIGVGVAVGAAIGAAFGASSRNMAPSLAMGLALGTVIGAIFDFSQRGRSKSDVVERIHNEG
jgi:uncharacterized membrane protein